MKGCRAEVRVVGQGILAHIGGGNSSASAVGARIGPLLPSLSNRYHSCISLHLNVFGAINPWLELERGGWRQPKQQGIHYCKNLFPEGVFAWKNCVWGFLKTEHDPSIPPSKWGSSLLACAYFLSSLLGSVMCSMSSLHFMTNIHL